MSGFYFSQEATNYYSDDEIEEVVLDNFKDSKKKVDEYKKLWQILMGTTTLILFFFLAILYAICFQLTEKTNACENEDELKNDITKAGLSELFSIKDKLKPDFDILNFHQQCHRVNQILNK